MVYYLCLFKPLSNYHVFNYYSLLDFDRCGRYHYGWVSTLDYEC